jgi:hypothetical protein
VLDEALDELEAELLFGLVLELDVTLDDALGVEVLDDEDVLVLEVIGGVVENEPVGDVEVTLNVADELGRVEVVTELDDVAEVAASETTKTFILQLAPQD